MLVATFTMVLNVMRRVRLSPNVARSAAQQQHRVCLVEVVGVVQVIILSFPTLVRSSLAVTTLRFSNIYSVA
jgi:hypothetical protein